MKLSATLILLLLIGCGGGGSDSSSEDTDDNGSQDNNTAASFANDVQPIFDGYCISCHTSGGSSYFLPLTSDVSFDNVVNQGSTRTSYSTGETVLVVPGDSSSSVLYKRISQTADVVDGEQRMPLNRDPLGSADQGTIKNWIDEGALDN